jgi:acyl carrier protein
MSDLLLSVRQVVATLFNAAIDSVSDESAASNVEGWDSMGQLMLVLELEQQFGLQIPPEESETLTSVAKIVDYLKIRVE